MLAILFAATLGFLGDAEGAGARFVVHESATYDGRSVLHFRTLEFARAPVRPITTAVPLGSGVLYGLLPVGSGPEAALTVVWNPRASGGPQLWVDADGDGKLTMEECHVFARNQIEIPIHIAVRSAAGVQRLRRTILFRRSSVADGLSYAVRGYAAGTLNLGGTDYAALLTDGNADGCFDTVGSDRIWIDLDRDGHFDGLTEQFLLGSPITVKGRIYIIRSNATASEVRVHARSTARGSVRLTLTDKPLPPVSELAVQLVSEFGELAPIRDLSQPVSLPVARYRVDSVLFRLTDRTGVIWSYRFVGGHRYSIVVAAGKESAAALLSGLAFEMTVAPAGGAVAPGQRLDVTPHLRTPAGLYLADCHMIAKDSFQPMTCNADIQLSALLGGTVDRISSGFA
jgi:hypothetical protein